MPITQIGIHEILKSSGGFRIKILKLLDFFVGSFAAALVQGRKEVAPGIPIRTVLVIRPGGIGDAIFLLPFLRHLRQAQPDLSVDLLCEKRNAQVFTSQSGLCRNIYLYDHWASFQTVFKKKYDAVIDTEQWHYLSALVAYALKPKFTIGFATRPLRARLFNKKAPYKIDAYEIENFRSLFTPIESSVKDIQDVNHSYRLTEALKQWAQEQNLGPCVTLALGASIPERRFTDSQLHEIIPYLLKKNLSVILIGGNDVRATADKLSLEFQNAAFKNFVGKLSLPQTAALIGLSRFFIGPDSGIMHLSCAVGTPTIAVFGPGNLIKWSPHGAGHLAVTENVSCSPCTLFGYTVPTCDNTYRCVRQLDIKKIFAAIDQSLRA